MAIFMTLLGKYSTRSHQREGELWQGDKMEAVIYLGALVCWMRSQPCTGGSQGRATAGWASAFHPDLPVLSCREQWWGQPGVRLSLPSQASWSTPASAASLEHQQQQRQGDRHQENQRRHLSSEGGSQGFSQSAQRDMSPTPVILARGAASKEREEEKNKSSIPQKINWKEGARRFCFVQPYLEAGTSTCLVSRYIWQIKENEEYVTCSNFAVLWYPPALHGTIIKSLWLITSTSGLLSWRAQGWHLHHGPAFALAHIQPDLPQKQSETKHYSTFHSPWASKLHS